MSIKGDDIFMRLLVFFDLPVTKKDERKIATKFRKELLNIQRAAQFLFLITRSFGGKGDTFGTVKKSSGGASKSQRNILEKIDAIHHRLDKVLVENRDFEKLIKQYDFEDSLTFVNKGCKILLLSLL